MIQNNELPQSLLAMMDIPPAPRSETVIVIQRSELEEYLTCPLQGILCRIARKLAGGTELCEVEYYVLSRLGVKPEQVIRADADLDRPAEVGTAFHAVLEQYIDVLLETHATHDAKELMTLAQDADAKYQPDLLHMARLTGRRLSIWPQSHICHEKQLSYRLPSDGVGAFAGPNGESVALTTKPDYVAYGSDASELVCRDWKTGYRKDGFDFQAMFTSVVVARSMEGVARVTWTPFFCRFGSWGRPHTFAEESSGFDDPSLSEAESSVKTAVRDFLAEDEWQPSPGMIRCRWCRHKAICDAARAFPELDADPENFCQTTEQLELALKDRKAAMKAYYEAHGPIRVEGGWYGVEVLAARPSFKRNAGTPGYLGEDSETQEADE